MKIVLLIAVFCAAIPLYGQYTENITSSRPGQAFTPLTPGKNVFQLQTGVNINGLSFDSFVEEVNGFNYSALLRYGINERIEFRTTAGYSRFNTKPQDVSVSGINTFAVGSKINLINGAGNNPKVGIQADFQLPVVDEDFRADKVATTLLLAHNQGLDDNLALSTNFGVFWDGNGSDALGIYVVNLSFTVFDDLGAFIEGYGFFNSDIFDIFFDGGFAYLLNENLQLDISGGYGSNEGVKQYFVDFGFSWRARLSQ